MPPPVSIIIVSWNALPLLQRCLPSVVATRYEPLEIILADNASTDGSAAWVHRTFPSVKIVRHPENWAFCRGNNAALPHASGEYVVLLNNDVEVPPDWLAPLVAAMEADPSVGAAQPKLLQYDRRDHFEYAGGAGGYLDRFGYPFTRGRVFFSLEKDEGQYDDERDVFWATGAALLLRRRALDAVGLLDERFFMHMEEIDLCWRLWRQGWRVRIVPRSVVYHIGGGSLPRSDTRKAYYNFRNNLLLLYKNLPPRAWRRIFPRRALLDALAAARALLAGRPAEAAAIARAYRDAHRMKDAYRDARPERCRTGPYYRGSIVLDYFLRGRRRFRDLPPACFFHPDEAAPPLRPPPAPHEG
ncbi:glycosyltransferase family 2 protein [Rhodocaloribacter litoris]|uniref:glycosyltransferase family 2 protein n=1 Tax=Rhodocaloribacter litoris TaxID=2558931 RepID=UPI00142108CE|nr:glycosyltransferase family 2 protein [Rhodocaloribacter litoris]QXD15304.1 glycosyltransferase family 2 protein [Rhodocaloribacter litoris]